MRFELADAAEVISWIERIYSLVGLWPLRPNDLLFSFFFVYLCVHLTLEWAQFIFILNNLQRILASASEMVLYQMVFCKLCFYRTYRDSLGDMIKEIKGDFEEKSYKTPEEKKVFLKYNTIAKLFIKIALPLLFTSTFLYFLRPLTSRIGVKLPDNSTATYPLPYRTRVLYTMTPFRYALTYVCQSPVVIIVSVGYTGTDCLMITLVFHLCGQLAALGIRIRKVEIDPDSYPQSFKDIVNRHLQLIRMANKISDLFTYGLLAQVLGTTIILCLNEYAVLANTSAGQTAHLFTFAIYATSLIMLFFGYCYVGDCLINESKQLQEAFYHAQWYDMPSNQARALTICMARAKIPLQLTAGRFYIFSLASFNDVIKTSVAYLSVLRTFL